VAGHVVRRESGDSPPVPRARVVLHRVARATQGPVDSVLADAAGRFRFRFRPDTTAVYLVSARYAGIEYFSPPLHVNPARPDTRLRIVVADTSSRAPVELAARNLVVTAPRSDGTRGVLDFLVLRNPGDRTRVAADSLAPAWTAPLPPGSFGLTVGEGDYSPEAVERRGDRLVLLAPIAPGEKQVAVEYGLPAGARGLTLSAEQPVAAVNVLIEERGAQLEGPGLAPADTQVIQGRSYRRWTGAMPAGSVLRAELPGPLWSPRWILPALIALVGAALAAAAWRLIARRRPAGAAGAAAAPPPPDPDTLLTRLAELDLSYGGREGELPSEEWQRYRAERARLKAELEAALAPERRAL
jgi:hypothetical protein